MNDTLKNSHTLCHNEYAISPFSGLVFWTIKKNLICGTAAFRSDIEVDLFLSNMKNDFVLLEIIRLSPHFYPNKQSWWRLGQCWSICS